MAWTMPTGPGTRFTSDYGPRTPPPGGGSSFHRGIDLAPPTPGQTGQPVFTVGDGVVQVMPFNSARGNYMRVKHDDGSTTQYQHLASFTASNGQRVTAGTRIGVMGDTGVGTGIHLHFETFPSGVVVDGYSANAVDPEQFMTPRGVNLRTGQVTSPPTNPNPTPTPPEDDDMRHTIIFCDVDANGSNEYGSTAVIDPINGWVRTSTGLGPRSELDARKAIAGVLGFELVEKHVNPTGWLMAQQRYTR